jgi:ribonuclease HI
MSTGSIGSNTDGGTGAELPRVTIFTDGAAEPNPGPGGYGVVLFYGQHRKELSAGFQLTTNNRMELMGVIAGLEALKKPCRVAVYSDSKYVVDAIDKGWVLKWQQKNWNRRKLGPVRNPDLWKRFLAAAALHEVTMHWVKGHAGHEHNERCDVLAVAAAKGTELALDLGYRLELMAVAAIAPEVSTAVPKTPLQNSSVSHKEPGEPCRKCGTPIVKRPPKKKARKAGQTYYYEWYLHCPNCNTMYMVEEAKRMIDSSQTSMFDESDG